MRGLERDLILVVDDEVDNRELMQRVLRDLGRLVVAANGEQALSVLRQEDVRVIVCDHRMPGITGVELLERAAQLAPETTRILISAYGDVELLTDAINRGHVSHYLAKPIDVDALRGLVKSSMGPRREAGTALVLAARKIASGLPDALRRADIEARLVEDFGIAPPGVATIWPAEMSPALLSDLQQLIVRSSRRKRGRSKVEIIGRSEAMQRVFETVEQVARTQATVLLRGETGTGKELVARVLHSLSERSERPFVPVNVAALPEGLVESELFGHEKGAFTGAESRVLGRFERADGGTLFIDEVGEIPVSTQVKLLRVLQERAFERVGGTSLQKVDIRLVAATNRPLEEAIERGLFREDLFYRLNVVPLRIPPLRERREDIPLLVHYFLGVFQDRFDKEGVRLSSAMHERLIAHDWPGNVRELMNVVERAVALTPSGQEANFESLRVRAPRDRMAAMAVPGEGHTLREMMDQVERRIIAQALERSGGNRTHAARELGISRQGLAGKLKKHSL